MWGGGNVSHVGTYVKAEVECYNIHVGERLGAHRAAGTQECLGSEFEDTRPSLHVWCGWGMKSIVQGPQAPILEKMDM